MFVEHVKDDRCTLSVDSVDDRCKCGRESTYGLQVVIDRKLLSFYLCDSCYHAQEYSTKREDEL